MRVIESLNWPGKGAGTGDDRFGYDEAAGTAWVMDGATDVGPFRVFDREESDAAWVAQALTNLLIASPPGEEGGGPYFERILEDLRKTAQKKSRVELSTAPPSTWPIAAGMWLHAKQDTVECAWLGDCVALIQRTDGSVEVITTVYEDDLETKTSRRLNTLSPEERQKGLQDIRAKQNTDAKWAVFGLHPEAHRNLKTYVLQKSDCANIVLMTDGFWRLVELYKLMSPGELMERALSEGLEALARDLRQFEKGDAVDASARIKRADDACALLIACD